MVGNKQKFVANMTTVFVTQIVTQSLTIRLVGNSNNLKYYDKKIRITKTIAHRLFARMCER